MWVPLKEVQCVYFFYLKCHINHSAVIWQRHTFGHKSYVFNRGTQHIGSVLLPVCCQTVS